MGLFSTVLHVYDRSQEESLEQVKIELKENYGFQKFSRIPLSNVGFKEAVNKTRSASEGVYYLITEQQGKWTTIVEINVKLSKDFFMLDRLTNELSRRLNTTALSFSLYDGDLLVYNLNKKGVAVDQYNSDPQYFLEDAADKDEIADQRHHPDGFREILPLGKTVNGLERLLNEGYWNAFDNNDLTEDGIPNDDKYYVDEQERFTDIGKFLEIYSKEDYPFTYWYDDLLTLDLSTAYLLAAEREVAVNHQPIPVYIALKSPPRPKPDSLLKTISNWFKAK